MKERKPHRLGKLKSCTRPTSVIFFDTETKAEYFAPGETVQRLRLGVVIACRTIGEEYLREQAKVIFRTPDEFWLFVEKRAGGHNTTYLVAHNVIFDFVVLDGFKRLPAMGWKMTSIYSKGQVTILRWTKDKSKLVVLDNGNLFAGKLAEWGELIGLPKLEIVFDTADEKSLSIYCERDVEIMVELWRMWYAFLDDNRCGSFKPTIASTAMCTWRTSYQNKSPYLHNNLPAIALERASYRGGRVEALYQGVKEGERFYYLDVNNMYGYVLHRYSYPVSLTRYFEQGGLGLLEHKLQRYAVIARVALSVDENWFPYTYKGHTCYPLGSFTTCLTTPELILALDRGWIDSVFEMSCYYQENIFSDYVLHFREQREKYQREGCDMFAKTCKLMINSLYGKFGQKGFEQKEIGNANEGEIWESDVYDIVNGERYRQFALGGHVYEERRVGEGYNSFVAIASHVTAYARLHLAHLRSLVPAGHVYYMDTDSLIVDQVGYDALAEQIQSDTLGKLKVEYQADRLEINAAKDYVIGERQRLKGIRSEAVSLGNGIFEQDQWLRFNGMLKRGDLSNYVICRIVKQQRRTIFSGVVQPDGWIAPFVLQPEQGLFPVEISRETVQQR